MNNNLKKRLGIHIRLQGSMLDVLDRAVSLEVPFFQCFLVYQETGSLLVMSDEDIKKYITLKRQLYTTLFCHGSYWINLASLKYNGYHAFRREITLARTLEFTHFILHPGTAKGATEKIQGINALAFCLNQIMKHEKDITFVLENTCHKSLAIGSDINDFALLLERLDFPERIGFCIDTAHAHSFGYRFTTTQEYNDFIIFLDKVIGLEKIVLLHLNDSYEDRGSYKDKHATFGQGVLGQTSLEHFIKDERLSSLPFLLELPPLSLKEEKDVIVSVYNAVKKERE
jgi:deoxyribonuclease-4